MTTTESNKPIAEFMGAEFHFGKPLTVWNTYHKDWNMLMPVWYKFRDLKTPYDQQSLHNNYCAKIAQQLAWGGITNAYQSLVYGIQWYNEQQPK